MARWLIPSLLYVVGVGAMGVFAKLALRTLAWPDLILWTMVAYLIVGTGLLALGETELRVVAGSGWAMLAAAAAISTLIALYVALNVGKASTVSAISSAYPAVTLVLAAAFLAESLTPGRVAGVAIVIAGVVLLTLSD